MYGTLVRLASELAHIKAAPADLPFELPAGMMTIDWSRKAEVVKYYRFWVYVAVQAIMSVFGGRSVRVSIAGDEREFVRRRDNSPGGLLLALLEDVNERMTARQLWMYTVLNYRLTGEAYWWLAGRPANISRGEANWEWRPSAIWPLPSHWMSPKIDAKTGKLIGWTMMLPSGGGASAKDFSADEIVPIIMPTADVRGVEDLYRGYSPLQAGSEWIDVDHDVARASRFALRNDAMIGLIFETDVDTAAAGKAKFSDLRAQLAAQYEGIEKNRRAFFLYKGWRAHELRATPREMDFIQTSRWVMTQVLAIMGPVPPSIIGVPDTAHRTTSVQQARAFADIVINPMAAIFGECLTEYLARRFAPDLVIDFEPWNPVDPTIEQREWDRAVSNGCVLKNELRSRLGLSQLDELEGEFTGSGFGLLNSAENERSEELADQDEKGLHRIQVGRAAASCAHANGVATFAVPRTRLGLAARPMQINGFLRLQSRNETRLARDMRKLLREVAAEVIARLETDGPDKPLMDSLDVARRMGEIIRPHLLRSAHEGATLEAVAFLPAKGGAALPFAIDKARAPAAPFGVPLPDNVLREINQWLDTRDVAFWQQISQRMAARVRQLVRDGLEKGNDPATIARQLRSRVFDASRALTIARTETTGAMGAGHQLMRDELQREGIIEGKEWISTIDDLTRDGEFSHIDANGQVVPNQENFVVSGESLMYPGDGSHGASAGNIVNCRCASFGMPA